MVIGTILDEVSHSKWTWWVRFHMQPQREVDEIQPGHKQALPHLHDKTDGNFALQLTKSESIHKAGLEMAHKVTHLVLQDKIGWMHSQLPSLPVVNALKMLVEVSTSTSHWWTVLDVLKPLAQAIMIETEKHAIYLEFPKQDLSRGTFEKLGAAKEKLVTSMSENLSAILEQLDQEKAEAYWKPITEDIHTHLANIAVINHNDLLDWVFEQDDIEALELHKQQLDKEMQNMALWTSRDCAKLIGQMDMVTKTMDKAQKGKSMHAPGSLVTHTHI